MTVPQISGESDCLPVVIAGSSVAFCDTVQGLGTIDHLCACHSLPLSLQAPHLQAESHSAE